MDRGNPRLYFQAVGAGELVVPAALEVARRFLRRLPAGWAMNCTCMESEALLLCE